MGKEGMSERLPCRVLTGPDDRALCERVLAALPVDEK